jgi:peptide/nickel transport system substrate-binding protein
MNVFKPCGSLFLVTGLAVILLLVVACAKSAEETGKPAPSPAPAAPAAAPAPATPATPTTAAKPAAPKEGEPLVAGGPPFFPSKVAQLKGWQIMQQYHQNKLPLWTQAKYGGDYKILFNIAFAESQSFRLLDLLVLNRPSHAGMLLYTDMGRCSWVGRQDFSACKGEQAHNKALLIVPGIFQRWDQPDPTTYVFTVRKGVLWPAVPGVMTRTDREVTAQDIAFFLDVTRREGILKTNFLLVKAIEASDRYTVKVTMLEPHSDFIRHMAHTSMGIFPKECYEHPTCLKAGFFHSVSPGPFLLKEAETRVKLIFDKNPEFHLKGLPYVDRLSVINVTDPAALSAAFRSGQNDNISSVNLTEAEKLLRELPGTQLHAQGGIGGVTITLRPLLKGPLADVRVRRAMAMTIDHPTLWEVGNGGFTVLTPLISRDYFGEEFYMTLEQAGEWYQFNPERAKKLMAEAGYPNGFATQYVTTSTSGQHYDFGLHLQAQWKKYLGIDLKVLPVDFTSYNNQFYGGAWEGLIGTGACWIRSCWGIADDAFAQFLKGSPQNVQKLADPIIEEMYLKQRRELDPAKRVKLLWEFDQYEATQLYQIRLGVASILGMMQPWEMNGASHETAWFIALNGPTWLAMHDTSKYPGGKR